MAARLYTKNKYENWSVIYNLEKNKASEKAGTIFQEMDKAKKDQDDGITYGGLQRIHYRRYLHDPSPLFLCFSYKNAAIRCFVGVNLHYLISSHAQLLLKKVLGANKTNTKQGRTLVITYDMIKGLRLPILAYRNYKYDRTRPIEYIPQAEWMDVAKTERSPWQGRFYGEDQSKIDKAKKDKRKRRNKAKKKRKKSK